MSDTPPPNPTSWLPASIVASDYEAPVRTPTQAWAHLLERLDAAAELTRGNAVVKNDADLTAGIRHLLVLLAVGAEELLRYEPDAPLRIARASMDDILTWGMECPDGVYTNAILEGGGEYRIWGNRGTARYVGIQTMNGQAATANILVDELDIDADGNFELFLTAEQRDGNWLKIEGDHPTLTVRHFFYDWENEVRSSLEIERINELPPAQAGEAVDPLAALTRRIGALGDFLFDNLKFFLDFGEAPPANDFLPPADMSAMGAARENQVVIGRFDLEPGQALIASVTPPEGVYWSFSLGNSWWETIHYGKFQSSLNGHQADIDDDGKVRVVISAEDPGVANWLDTTGVSNGPIINRCVRTSKPFKPDVEVVPVGEVLSHLPTTTRLVTPQERAATIATRTQLVRARFAK